MMKNILFIPAFCLFAASVAVQTSYAKNNYKINRNYSSTIDSLPPADLMDIVKTVVYATDKFDIKAVADLYTPNAVVADNEPPFSWNGPTAGIQWVNAVEKTCKEYKLKGFKGQIGRVSVYLQTEESIYVVVPVD